MLFNIVVISLLISVALAFKLSPSKTWVKNLKARRNFAEEIIEGPKHTPGVDIPEIIAKQSAIYDMILVERLSSPEKTDFGLFLPKVEGQLGAAEFLQL